MNGSPIPARGEFPSHMESIQRAGVSDDVLATELLTYLRRHGAVMPSYREMKEALGVSSLCVVSGLILKLERAGYIRRLPRRARAIELVEAPTRLRVVFGPGHFEDRARLNAGTA